MSNNAYSEDAFRLRVNDQLGHAFGTIERQCATRGAPWKFYDLDCLPLRFCISLGKSTPCEFRVGKDDSGYDYIFRSAFFTTNNFNVNASLASSFMRQQHASGDISNRIN